MEISVRTPLDVLKGDFKELAQWIQSICRFGKIENFVITDYKEERLHLTFFTKDHSYHISARLPETMPPQNPEDKVGRGYLGCTVQCRKPRAGEDWTRGNDLADGSYRKETWQKILEDIVANELVKVIKPTQTKIKSK